MMSSISPSVERIIRAAEAEGSQFISNKNALAACIEICFSWYREALLYSSRGSQDKERAVLRRLQTLAIDLDAQLGNAPLSFYEPFIPKVAPLREQLSDLAKGIESTLKLQSDSAPTSGYESDFVDHLGYQDHFKSRSGFEWLAGVYLVETFELNFKTKERINRRQYVAFVLAVLKELKIKNGKSAYSVESIRRAVRAYRSRRKVKEVDDLQFALNRQAHLAAACGIRWK